MKITDLDAEAARRNINLHRTTIKSSPVVGNICLTEGYGRWSVFYCTSVDQTSENRFEKHFFDESDACLYLLELVAKLETDTL